eukprot:TRINITY_DN22471_c0_g1_i1.p1 TRINITY_DN22471_c0_g1~~TRINITY_DN22471_c0_g1_i1.p1  ORF type:complete len:469 (-),score=60.24 TRINITY_DN22471_c0_g1_i1:295-1701(-)
MLRRSSKLLLIWIAYLFAGLLPPVFVPRTFHVATRSRAARHAAWGSGLPEISIAVSFGRAETAEARAEQELRSVAAELTGGPIPFLSLPPNKDRLVESLTFFTGAAEPVTHLLDSTLEELLPSLDVERLCALLVCMARVKLKHKPAWSAVQARVMRSVSASSSVITPGQAAEMAWSFARADQGDPELFSTLRTAMTSAHSAASDQESRVFSWACATAKMPSFTIGTVSPRVESSISQRLWRSLHELRRAGCSIAYEGGSLPVTTQCEDPVPVVTVSDVVSASDSAELVRLADDNSLWVSSEQAGSLSQAHGRTSASAMLGSLKYLFHPSVLKVRSWVAATLGVPDNHIEPLQLVRYTQGQKYSRHADWNKDDDADLWVFGQRMATVLIYLNTMPEDCGGATVFHDLDLSIVPKQGTAVIWPNVAADGSPSHDVFHEAQPVLCEDEVKYAVNVWIRGQPHPDNTWIGWR